MNLQAWIIILIVAFIGEAIWETCKMFVVNKKVSKDRIGALIVCELVAFGAWLDIFSAAGASLTFNKLLPPIVGSIIGVILTGLLISRGANFIHDILKGVSNIRENTTPVPKTINPGGQITNIKNI